LHEYFNSYVSLWLVGKPKKRVQDMYVQSVMEMIVTELDEAWSVGSEKGVRMIYRPILFDLMRQRPMSNSIIPESGDWGRCCYSVRRFVISIGGESRGR
jgi:hypothetical protein